MTLEREVKRRIRKLGCNVKFEIRDGIVFLKGRVESHSQYLELGWAIGSIKGVEGVVNDVEYPGKRKREEKRRKLPEKFLGEYDVVIIGAGVTGAMIARELSKYKVKVALVEKEEDVALGASRANNGMIHPGVAAPKGTLKAKLNVKGNRMYEKLCEELGVKFKRVGSIWIFTPRTFSEKRIPKFLERLLLKYFLPRILCHRARKRGIPCKVLSREEILKLEPNINRDVISGIYLPTTGILDPYDLVIALVENAVQNGVDLYLGCEVIGFQIKDGRVREIYTTLGKFKCKYVINAAGVHADEVAELAGAREYTIHPRKGVEVLFHKDLGSYLSHCIAEVRIPPPKRTKGGGINPTVHGNPMWGPTAVEVEDKEDTSVKPEEIEEVISRYKSIFPGFPMKIIRYFAGVRPATFTEDFIIRPAKWIKGFIHVAGIQSPGLASSPAIAEMVIDILRGEGLKLEPKEDFKSRREPIPRASEMSLEELSRRIKEDPRWGRVICYCEGVTEAEIVEAIRRGARTIDGIKRRTRAGMGECQGSRCLLEIAEILARELGIPMKEVLKESRSKMFDGEVKS